MQLGNLRRLIQIESYTVSTDANGQEIKTWSVIDTVWANLIYEMGSESYQADQRVAQRMVKWIIRYRADVDETCRILYEFNYFNVRAIERLHRKRYLILKCEYADRES